MAKLSERLERVRPMLSLWNHIEHLNILIHNVKVVKGLMFKHEPDDNTIHVKEDGGEYRSYRCARFMQRYWELLVFPAHLGETWTQLQERVKGHGLKRSDFDTTINAISEQWGQIRDEQYEWALVTGDELLEAYEAIDSCMSDSPARDLYTGNPDKVKLLRIRDTESGDVRARALVWTTDEGITLMDRIYPGNNCPPANFARRVAKEQGWWHLSEDTYGCNQFVKPDGEVVRHTFKVTLKDCEAYPYMDTLYWATLEDGVLTLSNECMIGAVEMRSTENESPWEYYRYCCICDDHIHEEDAYYHDGESYCEYCFSDRFCTDYTGEIIALDDAIRIDVGSYWGHYAHVDEVQMLYNGYYCLDDEAVCIDIGPHAGEYAHEDDVVQDYNGNYILYDDAVEIDHGSKEGQWALLVETAEDYRGLNVLLSDLKEIEKGPLAGKMAATCDLVEDYEGCLILEDESTVISDGRVVHVSEARELEGRLELELA